MYAFLRAACWRNKLPLCLQQQRQFGPRGSVTVLHWLYSRSRIRLTGHF